MQWIWNQVYSKVHHLNEAPCITYIILKAHKLHMLSWVCLSRLPVSSSQVNLLLHFVRVFRLIGSNWGYSKPPKPLFYNSFFSSNCVWGAVKWQTPTPAAKNKLKTNVVPDSAGNRNRKFCKLGKYPLICKLCSLCSFRQTLENTSLSVHLTC